ncbi:MAG TPA: helix-turn-helix domain-containing protein, partial [Micavibrio sp.]
LQNVLRYICVMFEGDTITEEMLPRALLQGGPSADETEKNPRTHLTRAEDAAPPDLKDHQGSDLPGWLQQMSLADIERQVIESTVTRMRGNVPLAAAHLGVAPSTLYRKRLAWLPEQESPHRPDPIVLPPL